ncbi:MAG: hypothetical protein ACI906_004757 [Candidatus Latescibacterota bacterium]|jgi:hypothetical protein
MAAKEILQRRRQKTIIRPRTFVGVVGLFCWIFVTIAAVEISWERFGNEANYLELALVLLLVVGGFVGWFYLLGVRPKKRDDAAP